jgi:hypothetical protein
MAASVDEPTKKARAATLLSVAADARARRATADVGGHADVLFESRLADGRWVGHAADYVTVAVDVPQSRVVSRSLENSIGRVAIDRVDPLVRDRVIGSILAISPPPADLAFSGASDGR